MTLYVGIDLHANNSVIVLLNEQDQVMYQQRLDNHLPTILEQLAPYHTEIKGVVVESTYNWYWLVDGLMDADYRVHLANPAAMQQYSGLKHTDDRSDARWLAHLLRLGVLPEGYIYPKAERAVRDLLRKRSHLVNQHTSNVLSVQNILVRNSGSRFGVKQIHNLNKTDLEALLPDAHQILAVISSLKLLECLRQQINTLVRNPVIVSRQSGGKFPRDPEEGFQAIRRKVSSDSGQSCHPIRSVATQPSVWIT